jgi:hypothetical protein
MRPRSRPAYTRMRASAGWWPSGPSASTSGVWTGSAARLEESSELHRRYGADRAGGGSQNVNCGWVGERGRTCKPTPSVAPPLHVVPPDEEERAHRAPRRPEISRCDPRRTFRASRAPRSLRSSRKCSSRALSCRPAAPASPKCTKFPSRSTPSPPHPARAIPRLPSRFGVTKADAAAAAGSERGLRAAGARAHLTRRRLPDGPAERRGGSDGRRDPRAASWCARGRRAPVLTQPALRLVSAPSQGRSRAWSHALPRQARRGP